MKWNLPVQPRYSTEQRNPNTRHISRVHWIVARADSWSLFQTLSSWSRLSIIFHTSDIGLNWDDVSAHGKTTTLLFSSRRPNPRFSGLASPISRQIVFPLRSLMCGNIWNSNNFLIFTWIVDRIKAINEAKATPVWDPSENGLHQGCLAYIFQ